MRMRTSDKKIHKIFSKHKITPHIRFHSYQGNNIRFIEINETQCIDPPLIIFVHGAPGESKAFFKYLYDSCLIKKANLLVVDRLGYGHSSYGKAVTSLNTQAESLDSIIQYHQNRKIILVGHSYGGPIIAKYAMNHPDLIHTLIFIAPAIDPEHEKIFWLAHLGKYPPFKWVLSKPMRVATKEKFSHVQELKKIEPHWDKIHGNVLYIHGKKDMIVPFENYHFAKKKLSNAVFKEIIFPKENHFIPWTQRERIIQELIKLIEGK